MKITLTGENSFALKSELDKLVTDFVQKNGDMALERLDGEEVEYQQIYDALTSLPFLASRKMIIIRTPSTNKKFAENAEILLKDLPETTDLILVEPKFDKRSSLYKTLKKATDYREFNNMDAHGLAQWLSERAKNQKGSLHLDDARFLVDRIGTNQQTLSNELDKLLIYEPRVTRSSIELLTEPTPQSSIFELLDAAFAGDGKKTMKLYSEQRAQKVEPQQIIAMLAWQLHVLALLKTAGRRTPEQIAREAKLNPYVVSKTMKIARNLSHAELKKLTNDLLELDIRLKTESIDADEALQFYLLQIVENS